MAPAVVPAAWPRPPWGRVGHHSCTVTSAVMSSVWPPPRLAMGLSVTIPGGRSLGPLLAVPLSVGVMCAVTVLPLRYDPCQAAVSPSHEGSPGLFAQGPSCGPDGHVLTTACLWDPVSLLPGVHTLPWAPRSCCGPSATGLSLPTCPSPRGGGSRGATCCVLSVLCRRRVWGRPAAETSSGSLRGLSLAWGR